MQNLVAIASMAAYSSMLASAKRLRVLEQDRVEASPEQMARCSAEAERFSKTTGVLTRIIGWYHSHPHITVHPSHVDVRTQVTMPAHIHVVVLPTYASVKDDSPLPAVF